MRFPAAFALLLFVPAVAHAGAWTLPEGTGQIISLSAISEASRSYDGDGNATERISFRKSFISVYGEYGWNDWLTLVAVPEYADATSAVPNRVPEKARDFAFSGGARVRLMDDIGVLSMEALARSAGAFELDTSYRQKPGEDFEIRILYGTHFELFGRDGCFDIQVAQRWATGGRPDETPVDVSAMIDVGWKTQALLQTFNVVSEGSGDPPFGYYRYHKLSLSFVRPVWGKTSLQVGGFISPAGQNALKEQGFFLSLWTKF
ncbi:MAG TPA: hypothetical protein VG867_03055 [Rhizomicrobium sp.]|nr:hypothetical protein [Rhizomicrobium sp.]